jgi:hypothetical protein
LQTPKAGDVIRSSGGLRKVRWTAQGRGKRGGSRVIYYFQDSEDRIYLVYGYTKNESEELTPEQIRVLANIVKGTVDG